MLNGELSSEELNTMVGNSALQQLVATATSLFEKGYSKEEVESVLVKTFDLSNPTLRNGFESLCSMYISDTAVEPERVR